MNENAEGDNIVYNIERVIFTSDLVLSVIESISYTGASSFSDVSANISIYNTSSYLLFCLFHYRYLFICISFSSCREMIENIFY